LDANDNPGQDNITFNIPGSAPFLIRPATPLPEISDAVTIDATTQPGFTNHPVVELEGTNAGADANGLTITSEATTVRGLSIHDFAGAGIFVTGFSGNVIQGNYLGVDSTGAIVGSNGIGLAVINSSNNTVGGVTPGARNVISGNTSDNILIAGDSTNN